MFGLGNIGGDFVVVGEFFEGIAKDLVIGDAAGESEAGVRFGFQEVLCFEIELINDGGLVASAEVVEGGS